MSDDKKVRVGCGIMILKDGKVLLGHRHEDAEKASSALHGEGTWTMPGGKLEFGETPQAGLCREVLEETGLKFDPNNLRLISVTNDMVPDAHFITLGFICEESSGEPQTMEPDEITEWRWFGFDELPSKIFSPSQKIIDNWQANKIYSN